MSKDRAKRSQIIARAAEEYRRLLAVVFGNDDLETGEVKAELDEAVGEDGKPSELTVQGLWASGMFGTTGETTEHQFVNIVEFGEWNRGAGPDFLRAEIEIDGKTMRGDIEIDPQVQDWERHGHGANPHFNRVVLHVVLTPPPPGWYTRTEQHNEVAVLYLSPERVSKALRRAQEPICSPARFANPCHYPLAEMRIEDIIHLMQAVASHRIMCKRKRFRDKADALGWRQAWYEAWAETLGYSANKEQMVMLARRAPLSSLGRQPEAMLLGVAGFLKPSLPDGADDEGRGYYQTLWNEWWKLQSFFGVEASRSPEWCYTGVRPVNHPQRRVAALAVSVQHWRTISPLLNAESLPDLCRTLTGLRHEFWDCHCTINSPSMRRRVALVGKQRVNAFLSNYVLVSDTSDLAWAAYVRLPAGAASRRVLNTSRALFGQRTDLEGLLRYEYVHQAILQIADDFCTKTSCRDCLFPAQPRDWQTH